MLRVYHRVKINGDLLKPGQIQIDKTNPQTPFSAYLKGHEVTTIPAGKLVGITYNEYPFQEAPTSVEGGGLTPVSSISTAPSTSWSQTDIRMLDSQN